MRQVWRNDESVVILNNIEWYAEFRKRSIAVGEAIDSLGKFLTDEEHPKSISDKQIEEIHKSLKGTGNILIAKVMPVLKSFFLGGD